MGGQRIGTPAAIGACRKLTLCLLCQKLCMQEGPRYPRPQMMPEYAGLGASSSHAWLLFINIALTAAVLERLSGICVSSHASCNCSRQR